MGRKDWGLDIDGKKWTPQEITAQILLKLKRDAESYLATGDPSGYHLAGVLRRCAAPGNQEAGEIAGLEVLRIINGPTAAALGTDSTRPTRSTPFSCSTRRRDVRRVAASRSRGRLSNEGDPRRPATRR